MYQDYEAARGPRVYRYVVKHDEGLAPDIEGSFCTLACCKPMIRRTAQAGDWVFGFAPKSRAAAGLVYAMQVQEVVSMTTYCSDRRYDGRRDRIYAPDGKGNLIWQSNAYDDHPEPENWERDIGGRNVLVATLWWYFGDDYLDLSQFLDEVEIRRWRAQRGHRVNGLLDDDLSAMLRAMPDSARQRQRLGDGKLRNCGGSGNSSPTKRQQVAGCGSRSTC